MHDMGQRGIPTWGIPAGCITPTQHERSGMFAKKLGESALGSAAFAPERPSGRHWPAVPQSGRLVAQVHHAETLGVVLMDAKKAISELRLERKQIEHEILTLEHALGTESDSQPFGPNQQVEESGGEPL